jgi:hypothetical protein
MYNGVPTKPTNEWHGARVSSIQRLQCRIAALRADTVASELNRCGLLLEAPGPLKVGSCHAADLMFDGFSVKLPLRVAHVTTHYDNGRCECRIGFTFRLMSAADRVAFDSLIARVNERAVPAAA